MNYRIVFLFTLMGNCVELSSHSVGAEGETATLGIDLYWNTMYHFDAPITSSSDIATGYESFVNGFDINTLINTRDKTEMMTISKLLAKSRIIPSLEYIPYLESLIKHIELSGENKIRTIKPLVRQMFQALEQIDNGNESYLESLLNSESEIFKAEAVKTLVTNRDRSYAEKILSKFSDVSTVSNVSSLGKVLAEIKNGLKLVDYLKTLGSFEEIADSVARTSLPHLNYVNSEFSADTLDVHVHGAYIAETPTNTIILRFLEPYLKKPRNRDILAEKMRELRKDKPAMEGHWTFANYLLGLPLSETEITQISKLSGLEEKDFLPRGQIAMAENIFPKISNSGNVKDVAKPNTPKSESEKPKLEVAKAALPEPEKTLSEQSPTEEEPGGFPWPIVGVVAAVAAIGGAAMMRRK